MSFSVHLCREIAVLLVLDVTVLCEQRHRLYREGEHATGTLIIEPVHETLLEPVEAIPMRCLTIREAEVLEEGLEIIAVVVTDIPEYGLEVTCTGGLVETVYDLLEAVCNDLVDRATLETEIYDFVGTLVVVLTKLLLNEIVHIHKELGCSARA